MTYQYLSHVERQRCNYPISRFYDILFSLYLLTTKNASVFKILNFISTVEKSTNIMHIKDNNIRHNNMRKIGLNVFGDVKYLRNIWMYMHFTLTEEVQLQNIDLKVSIRYSKCQWGKGRSNWIFVWRKDNNIFIGAVTAQTVSNEYKINTLYRCYL